MPMRPAKHGQPRAACFYHQRRQGHPTSGVDNKTLSHILSEHMFTVLKPARCQGIQTGTGASTLAVNHYSEEVS
jgi:hypothetical protein